MVYALAVLFISVVASPLSAADWGSAPDEARRIVHESIAGNISGKKFEPPAPDIQVGQTAPDFALQRVPSSSAGAARTTLNEFRGQVVLLDFWSTLCGPCRAATPTLATLHEKYGKRGLVVIGIDLQESAAKVKEYVKEHQVPYRVLLDSDASVARKYGVSAIPAFFVIDAKGAIVWRRTALRAEEMEEQVQKALAAKP
jgi:cytochrome c biogenesis protein CcmG, thiol:disulfide interchange protein DsbE